MQRGMSRRGFGAAVAAGAMLGGKALAAGADAGHWRVAESPHFRVYGKSAAETLRAFAGQLESFDWLLRAVHGLDVKADVERKLDIYMVGSTSELRSVWPGAPDGAIGFYTANPEDIFALSVREQVRDTQAKHDPAEWSESTLFHEYTHHFMLQSFPYAYPAWLVEGYAEYFGTTTIDGPVIEFGKFSSARVMNLEMYPWVTIETLLSKRPSELNETDAAMYYAQAWWLTHYMMEDPARYEQLKSYMAAVGKGGDPVGEMQKATGLTPRQLQGVLSSALEHKITYHRLTRADAPADDAITVTPLNAAADDLLLLNQRLRSGVGPKEAAAFVAEVRKRTARWPDDGLSLRLLARAEIEFGDRAAGKAAADRRLAAAPDDVEMLEIAAQARLDEADSLKEEVETGKIGPAARALAIEAQPFLFRAYKLAPRRYQTLAMYARCRTRLDDVYPRPNTLTALLEALRLAPQVKEIRFEAVRGLIAVKRWDDAAHTLAPLLNDPHSAGNNDAARKLAAEIEKGQSGG